MAGAANRFAQCPPGVARMVLAAFALMLVLAVATWPQPSQPANSSGASSARLAPAAADRRDTDLQLYDRIAARVAAGGDYYAAAMTEQRAGNYPVRPGLAVRLPTLAYVTAAVGQRGLAVLAAGLGLAVLAAWWRRLAGEPRRNAAMLLLVVGAALGLKPQYLVLHEVWAGMLLALALGLHRTDGGRTHWIGAWIAAALALAVREHALPFVLLLGALAAWRRDWREAAAWALLAALFATALALHLAMVDPLLLPTDRPSPSWLALRGLAGWTGNVVASSSLHLLPGPIAAPLALLPLIGWMGWRSDAGLTGTLLHAGYGLLFMIAGRDNNFYWALMVVPTWFIGLAFVPSTIIRLWQAVRGE